MNVLTVDDLGADNSVEDTAGSPNQWNVKADTPKVITVLFEMIDF